MLNINLFNKKNNNNRNLNFDFLKKKINLIKIKKRGGFKIKQLFFLIP